MHLLVLSVMGSYTVFTCYSEEEMNDSWINSGGAQVKGQFAYWWSEVGMVVGSSIPQRHLGTLQSHHRWHKEVCH